MRRFYSADTLPRFIEAIGYLQRATGNDAAQVYDDLCEKREPWALSDANKVFHMTIADAGGNPYLARAYARLLDEGRRLLHLHYSSVRSENSAFPLSPAHHQMVDAIEARDEAAADRLAHEHTRVLHDRMQEFIRVNYLDQPTSDQSSSGS